MPKSRSSAGGSLFVVSCITVLILILASPMLLFLVSWAGNFDWILLGNIGQAYGLASALVSSIALVAVARTLSVQAKQTRIGHLQAFRGMQAEVARFSFDYPDECLGTVGAVTAEEMKAAKANIFRTFYARFFCDGLEMGEFTEWEVRNEFAAGLLSTEGGRNWWRWARPGWVDGEVGNSRARLKFGRILDEVFIAQSVDEGSGPDVDSNYEGLAAITLSKGDIFSGKLWMPATVTPRQGPSEKSGEDLVDHAEQ